LELKSNITTYCRHIPNLICKNNNNNGYFTLLTRISTQLAVSFKGQLSTFLEELELFELGYRKGKNSFFFSDQ